MTPERAGEILARHLTPKARTIVWPVAAICIVAGVVIGWMLHNAYWRSSDMDYLMSRAIDGSAACKGITSNEQRRRIEDRIGKPVKLFTLDDKLVAIDYAFDRIEAQQCITTKSP